MAGAPCVAGLIPTATGVELLAFLTPVLFSHFLFVVCCYSAPQKLREGAEMSAGATGDAAPTSAAPAAAGSTNSNNNCASGTNCRVSLSLFYSCLACLGLVLGSPWLSPPPVLLQMVLYTAPILYIGSHLSLKQNEVDAITGERLNKGEAMDRTDAMLFPVFGSIALFSLCVRA